VNEMIFDVLKKVFETFGAPVFVPVVIFIIALFLKVTLKKAFISALSAGVGLMGFYLVINAYSPIITPIVNSMVNNSGVNLPVFDIGWQTTSIVAYSTEIGMIFVGVAILLQTILFLTRYTNIFQPGDLWNNYSYMGVNGISYYRQYMAWFRLYDFTTFIYAALCGNDSETVV
jgi:PTS system galactitol-specific IIC component